MCAAKSRGHETFDVECCCVSLHFHTQGHLVLLDGSATIFGAPLVRNARYQFSGCGVQVEAQGRARLDVEGSSASSLGTLNSDVHDIHAVLEAYRIGAAQRVAQRKDQKTENETEERLQGPRVLVVGDQNTGKSTLCRWLTNLATRQPSCGIALVDVDVGQQSITCPGSVATAFIEAPIPVDDGLSGVMPLSFFFGDKMVTVATRKRYLDLCSTSAQAIASVGFANPQFECGGIIVNTMGWITDLGRDLLMELVTIFDATHIIVTGSDRELEEAMAESSLVKKPVVLRYAKQADILQRGANFLSNSRTQQLVVHFGGTQRNPLTPARTVLKCSDVVFVNALTLEQIGWGDVKPCSVAAVCWADSLDTVADANVCGYVVLLEVGKKFVAVLAPASGDLPSPFLLVSSTIRLPISRVPPLRPE